MEKSRQSAGGMAGHRKKPLKVAPSILSPLLSRHFTPNANLPSDTQMKLERQFSVVSYNVLADCLSLRAKKEQGWYNEMNRNALLMSSRHPQILEELLYLDADIYCLQEVGLEYYRKLKLCMERNGYKGFFMKRIATSNYHDEGEACFVRTSQFAVVKHNYFVLHELASKEMERIGVLPEVRSVVEAALKGKPVLLVLQLKHKSSGCALTVGNVHMSWGVEMKRFDKQCTQISSCIHELLNQAGDMNQPHIFCGDFNSTPDTPGYQLAQDGYLNDENMEKLQKLEEVDYQGQKTSVINLWWKGFQHMSSALQSSYKITQGCEPFTSCFPHDKKCRAVDYIWYSKTSCDLVGVLDTLPEQYIKTGMPNKVCPSDHLSLKSVFQFK